MVYNTESHAKIIDFLKRNKEKAFSAEEIYLALKDKGVAKSTVFRQLSGFVSSSLVRRISDGKNRSVTYQYLGEGGCSEHLHLKCKNCGKLIHLDKELSHSLEESIKKASNFSIDSALFIAGICDDCEYREKI